MLCHAMPFNNVLYCAVSPNCIFCWYALTTIDPAMVHMLEKGIWVNPWQDQRSLIRCRRVPPRYDLPFTSPKFGYSYISSAHWYVNDWGQCAASVVLSANGWTFKSSRTWTTNRRPRLLYLQCYMVSKGHERTHALVEKGMARCSWCRGLVLSHRLG